METDGRFDSGKCGKGLIFIITIGPTDRFIEYKVRFMPEILGFLMIKKRFILMIES